MTIGFKVAIKKTVDEAKIKLIAQRLKKGLKKVYVGVPEGAGDDENGTPLAVIAAANEFGTADGHIPERSFMRSTVAENRDKYMRLNVRNARTIMRGGQTMTEALHQLGVMAVGDVQKKIAQGDFEANAASTVKRKGSSHPLIDTGRLRQSINYQVGEKGG